MKIALMADIHGNYPALKSCLDDLLTNYGKIPIYFLGDYVGYYPFVNECIEAIRHYLSFRAIIGNHDYFSCCVEEPHWFNTDAQASLQYTRKALTEDNRAWLNTLPKSLAAEHPELNHKCFFTHGSPVNPLKSYLYKDSEEAAEAWLFMQEHQINALFVGHTHIPCVEEFQDLQKRWIINPGAIGQPRDLDWRASYAVVDFLEQGKLTHEIRRVEYNVTDTVAAIQNAGLPEELSLRLSVGR